VESSVSAFVRCEKGNGDHAAMSTRKYKVIFVNRPPTHNDPT
jgi:hypothetical protein